MHDDPISPNADSRATPDQLDPVFVQQSGDGRCIKFSTHRFDGAVEFVSRTLTPEPSAAVDLEGVGLLPCPFCGVALVMRAGVNPYGRCGTEGCWTNERRVTVPLHDLAQVEQWNTRAYTNRGEVERLREACLTEIQGHADMANDVIRLGRMCTGGGRVKVATCLHHIARLARAALSSPDTVKDVSATTPAAGEAL